MKRITLFTALFALMLSAPSAFGAFFMADEAVFLDQAIEEDAYVVGESVSISQAVQGDALLMGAKVSTGANVEQDLTIAGGDVSAKGSVEDDLRVAGASVTLDGEVGGDTMVAGGTVEFGESSLLQGDLFFAGGEVSLNGTVKGNAKGVGENFYLNGTIEGDLSLMGSQKIFFGPKASVLGNLSYRSPAVAERADEVTQGQISYKPIEPKAAQEKKFAAFIVAGFSIYQLLSMLFFGLFMLWLYRYLGFQVSAHVHAAPLKSLGIGLLFAIATPIAAILAMLSIIGLPLGMVMLVLWGITLYMGKILAAFLIGSKLLPIQHSSPFGRLYLSFALGALVYCILSLIPFLGGLANGILALMAIGGIALFKGELMVAMRKKKML